MSRMCFFWALTIRGLQFEAHFEEFLLELVRLYSKLCSTSLILRLPATLLMRYLAATSSAWIFSTFLVPELWSVRAVIYPT